MNPQKQMYYADIYYLVETLDKTLIDARRYEYEDFLTSVKEFVRNLGYETCDDPNNVLLRDFSKCMQGLYYIANNLDAEKKYKLYNILRALRIMLTNEAKCAAIKASTRKEYGALFDAIMNFNKKYLG